MLLLELFESSYKSLTKEDATFTVKACREWLKLKKDLESAKDESEYGNIPEDMNLLNELLLGMQKNYGFNTVNDMYKAAKAMLNY